MVTAAAFWAGCEGSPSRPNVILIVVDTLRADHLSCYGYERETSPVIDAFASENLQFELAMATAPWTAPSMASIFTGLYPAAHGVGRHSTPEEADQGQVRAAVLDSSFETLAEALAGNGYLTLGVTANAWVADYLGFAQGFEEFATLDYRPANHINFYAMELIKAVADGPQPFMLYMHYMDPHMPYLPQAAQPPFEPLLETPHVLAERSQIDLYDGEIRYLDAQIGIFFEQLRELGLYRDAVIVLVADHGEEFSEHGASGHGHNVFNYDLHVPLILKAPGQQGRVEQAVSILDIYPTILELTGTRPSVEVEGGSLLRSAEEQRAGVFSESTRGRNHKAFTRSDGKKLVLAFDAESTEVVDEQQELRLVGLFDIVSDYYEKSSLEEDAALLSAMRSAFYSTYRESVSRRLATPPEAVDLKPETVRELKALGYLQ